MRRSTAMWRTKATRIDGKYVCAAELSLSRQAEFKAGSTTEGRHWSRVTSDYQDVVWSSIFPAMCGISDLIVCREFQDSRSFRIVRPASMALAGQERTRQRLIRRDCEHYQGLAKGTPAATARQPLCRPQEGGRQKGRQGHLPCTCISHWSARGRVAVYRLATASSANEHACCSYLLSVQKTTGFTGLPRDFANTAKRCSCSCSCHTTDAVRISLSPITTDPPTCRPGRGIKAEYGHVRTVLGCLDPSPSPHDLCTTCHRPERLRL